MRIVLDTNCFISCVGKKSQYRKVFDAFLTNQYILCVSSEVLLEYEEKFAEFWGEEVAHNLLGVILTSENISLNVVYYNFFLVDGDIDDNKFSDLYLSASADFLVTNDKKLLAVRENDFPVINTITLQEFLGILKRNR